MLCDTCKQQEATVFLTQIIGETVQKTSLCETCAVNFGVHRNSVPVEDLIKKLGWISQLQSGGFDKMVNGMGNRDPRYAKEAYKFVLESFWYFGLQRSLKKDVAVTNISSRQLLEVLRASALGRFGTNAKATLNGWGVFKTEDFGEIVFNMVEAGVMSARPEDSKEDFRNGYNFDESFPG